MTSDDGSAALRRLRFIVVDTNTIGGGKVQLDQVEGLAAELAAAGVVVLVPEVVLWEWAEHAQADLSAYYARQQANLRVLRGARIPGASFDVPIQVTGEPVAVERVLEHLTEQLEGLANVQILPTAPEAALAGLRAQVLQQGPGEKKSGTKTGAADMAWVHSAVEHANHDSALLAFLSNDPDIDKACDHLGVERPLRFTSRKQAVEAIRHLVKADHTAVVNEIARYVCGSLPAPVAMLNDKLTELVSVLDEESVHTVLPPWRMAGVSVREVAGLAAVEDVRIERPEDAPHERLVTATLTIVGTVAVLLWEGDHSDGAPWDFRDVAMKVPITAAFDGDRITRLRPAGSAQLVPTASRFPTVHDAKAALADALGRAPGLDGIPWDDVLNGEHLPEVAERFPPGLDIAIGFLDDEEHWSAQFLIQGRPHMVLIQADPYEETRMKLHAVQITTPVDPSNGPAKSLDGPVAAVAHLISRLFGAG